MSVKKNLDVIIVEKLKDSVVQGDWFPGQKLQIDDIAKEYGVSRTPIIQAVRMMAVEGMLVLGSNGKVAVPEFTPRQIEDIARMRLLLESEALRVVCRDKGLSIEELTRLADECACAMIENDVVKSRKKDLAFHKALVCASANECLVNLYVKVQGQYAVCNYLIAKHDHAAQLDAVNEHFAFLRLLRDYDTHAASEMLEGHINRATAKIVKNMRRVGA